MMKFLKSLGVFIGSKLVETPESPRKKNDPYPVMAWSRSVLGWQIRATLSMLLQVYSTLQQLYYLRWSGGLSAIYDQMFSIDLETVQVRAAIEYPMYRKRSKSGVQMWFLDILLEERVWQTSKFTGRKTSEMPQFALKLPLNQTMMWVLRIQWLPKLSYQVFGLYVVTECMQAMGISRNLQTRIWPSEYASKTGICLKRLYCASSVVRRGSRCTGHH